MTSPWWHPPRRRFVGHTHGETTKGPTKMQMGHCHTHTARAHRLSSIPESYVVNWGLLHPWHCGESAIDPLSPHNVDTSPTSFRHFWVVEATLLSLLTLLYNLTDVVIYKAAHLECSPLQHKALERVQSEIKGIPWVPWEMLSLCRGFGQRCSCLWSTSQGHQLPVDFWCKKLPSEALQDMPLEEKLLAMRLRNRGSQNACDPYVELPVNTWITEAAPHKVNMATRDRLRHDGAQPEPHWVGSLPWPQTPSHLENPLGSAEWTRMWIHTRSKWYHHHIGCCLLPLVWISLMNGRTKHQYSGPNFR